MGEYKYCYNCMETHEPHLTVCPYCGYDEYASHNPMYIAPGTILHDRYLVGVLISYNGEGATYIGYDKVISCKVLIREYMPINLCTRVKDKPVISVNYNNLAKYKAFMAEYTELNKTIARLRGNTNINPTLDMFAENNTTYTVFEYIDGVRLLDFLKDNAGELSWDQVSKIFPPLFTTISILHNAGLIHRAVSPETIYINDKGELKLSGFCISAVRTANAGLEYELFKGYAAPEQYSASSSSHQGSWTDVYSICALLYRMLTGCMPTDSRSRLENDDLCEPRMLNGNIPVHVSRVIMEGMNLSGRDRIQTVTELVTRLFEQPAQLRGVYPDNEYSENGYNDGYYEPQNNGYQDYSGQPNYDNGGYNNGDYYNDEYYNDDGGYEDQYDDEDEDSYNDGYRYEKVNTVDKIKVPIIIGILLFAVLMIIAVVFLNKFSKKDGDDDLNIFASSSVADNIVEGTTESETEPTTEDGDGVMFDLKGKFYESIKEKYKEYFILEADYQYNDEFEADQIFDQSVQPGEPFNTGDKIIVKVSKGKSVSIIPEYGDITPSQYESELKKAGISSYSFVELTAASSGTPNTVLQLQVDGVTVEPGSSFNNAEGKHLVIYYLSPDAVIATAAPSTEAPTEAQTNAPTEASTEAPTEAQTNNEQTDNQDGAQQGNSPEYG